jgi:very-short-patch-repair endonuclease
MDSKFTVNIEDIANTFKSKKGNIKRLLINSIFEHNIDYIITQPNSNFPKNHGGYNKEIIMLTLECSQQIILRYANNNKKEILNIPEVTYIKRFLPKETEILDFIKESFEDIYKVKKEFKIDNYRIDLYIIDIKLAIECDEFNHKDRDIEYELKRQDYIEDKLHCKFIRFNPDNKNFKLSKLINEINKNIII